MPSSTNFFNRDVKEYEAVVRLLDPVDKVNRLRPGLTAGVEILVEQRDNVLQTPVITIAAGGTTAGVKAQPITDPRRIGDIANQFRKKYGAGDVEKYYSKFDVALELDLPRLAAA